MCHNVSLLLVQLGIEHVVLNVTHCQQTTQFLGNLHARRTHQRGAPGVAHTHYLVDYRGKFLLLGLIHAVGHIHSYHWLVGGNRHHFQLVDFVELVFLGDGRSGHTGKLVIHPEVVLERDRGKRLSGGLYLYALFRFDSLVQPVAIPASFHHTTGLLIHDFHLAVFGDDILVVAVKQRVGLEQLCHRVNSLRLYGIVCKQLIFLSHFLLVADWLVGHGRQLGGNVG